MQKTVAIVTGASSGIGKATALRLAQDFDAIVLAARGGNKLADAGDEVRAIGAEALVVEVDLSAPTAAHTVVQATLDKFGRIDAVVNVAGAVPGLDVFDMGDDQWNSAMALKFHGARRLTLQAWDALKASGGSVVFISGTAAVIPKAGAAALGAINAAIEALAKAFAERGIDDGVQVNSVSPGATMTARRQAMLDRAAAASGTSVDEVKRRFIAQAGIRRFGQAQEVANVIAFAVAPASRWMTGTVLRIDGGEVKSV